MSEAVGGWELVRNGQVENYRRSLANGVTIFAVWDGGVGTVAARVEPVGIGRTLSTSRFRDRESFWSGARAVLEMAANLPSLASGRESPAQSVFAAEVAGTVDAEPGCTGVPEAELTFTLVDGRTVTLIMSDEQAFDLCDRINALDSHVWFEQREDDEETAGEPVSAPVDDVDVPDVTEVRSAPDTGHDVITLLDKQFGVGQAHLMAHVDWSAVIVVGEPAVSALIERGDELRAAMAPRWDPAVANRPGERWVVLRRAGTF